MTPDTPPLVFAGPSVPPEVVRRLLPGAELRPPVRRGDLHAARMLRYGVFVVIDGVFAEEAALSPREVVDVLDDGAAFIGASSMGALRAADCAPAGAEGVGAIYRLYRSGAIGSEDEVAVAFSPLPPFPALSQPLAGLRLALRRARRSGAIDATHESRLLTAARALPYADRTWPAMCDLTGIAPGGRLGAFVADDAKRQDAERALLRVAARIAGDPNWALRPRKSRSTFGILDPPARSRRPSDALAGLADRTAPGRLVWLLVSGRATPYLAHGQTALGALARLDPALPADWPRKLEAMRWSDFGGQAEAARALSGELDAAMHEQGAASAEGFRMLAVARAMAIAPANPPDQRMLRLVEAQMTVAHGVSTWASLKKQAPPETVVLIDALHLWWTRAKSCIGEIAPSGRRK